MANKIKHIQRSHKTYSKNKGIFGNFMRKAFVIKNNKASKKSVLERIKSLFKRHQDR
jgi:hypothetical protein